MFENFRSKAGEFLSRPITSRWTLRHSWRLSTWWPSDSRNAMQQSLLRLLALAHRERLELIPLVTNLAREHRGGYRRRLKRLAVRLADGSNLVDALEQTPDVLPDDQVFALRFAEQTGTLDQTYRELVENEEWAPNRISANLRQTFIYSLATLFVIALVVAFSMTFVAPTMEHLYEEFVESYRSEYGDTDFALPWAFQVLQSIAWHFAVYWFLWLLLVVAVGWLCWSTTSRRFFRRTIATRWLRGVAATRSAEFLRLLSLAVEAGRPLPSALSTMARYHFDNNVRHKLMFARIEAEHRSDLWNVFTEADLLTAAESKALADASSDQSRVWMMRRLADWKEDRVARRHETFATLIRPAAILMLAAIVLFIGVAWIRALADLTYILAKFT